MHNCRAAWVVTWQRQDGCHSHFGFTPWKSHPGSRHRRAGRRRGACGGHEGLRFRDDLSPASNAAQAASDLHRQHFKRRALTPHRREPGPSGNRALQKQFRGVECNGIDCSFLTGIKFVRSLFENLAGFGIARATRPIPGREAGTLSQIAARGTLRFAAQAPPLQSPTRRTPVRRVAVVAALGRVPPFSSACRSRCFAPSPHTAGIPAFRVAR